MIIKKLEISTIFKLFIFLISQLIVLTFFMKINLPTYLDKNSQNINFYIQIFFFLISMALVLFMLLNFYSSYYLGKKEEKIDPLMQYITALEQINRDMQKFRHDYTNILLTLQGYLDNNDIENLKTYFQQYILKTEQDTLLKHRMLGSIDRIQQIEIKSLLGIKVLQALSLGIKVHVEVADVTNVISMNIIDLTRIIGILMDNAIEASQAVHNGEIRLAIILEKDGSILFIIQNSYEGEILNIGQLFQEKYSTKGKGRGMGLALVRHIMNTYPGAIINTRIEKGRFIQELTIY